VTVPSHPLQLACIACDPAHVYYTLNHLTSHCYREHPRSMGVRYCGSCGHRWSGHEIDKKRKRCGVADPLPCSCENFTEEAPDGA
jgi:hypothetical protein